MDATPLPPAVLASALQDVIHSDSGAVRAAKSFRYRKPDEHTRRQRAIAAIIDLMLDGADPEDGWSSAAIAEVRREEEKRGARRVVL
jgi:hypothetical protein